MRVTLMHNPDAGNESIIRESLLEAIRHAGHEVTYQSIKVRNYEQALKQPADLIAVAGGDGTVKKVSRHLVGRGVPIAILPIGTANNLARTLNISRSPMQLITSWDCAQRRRIDVGLATGPWGQRYFLESAGFGLFSQVLRQLQQEGKADFGHSAAELRHDLQLLRDVLMRRCPVRHWSIRIDGEDASGSYFLGEVMNTRYFGPNVCLAPETVSGSGAFVIVLLSESEREHMDHYLESRLAGCDKPPALPARHARHVQLRLDSCDFHLDDWLWPRLDSASSKAEAEADAKSQVVELSLITSALEFLT